MESAELSTKVVTNLDKVELLEEEELRRGYKEYKIRTGFESLDECTDGLVAGELVVVSGATKSGKSLFMKTIISNLCKTGIPPLVFEWEEINRYFLDSFPNRSKDMLFYMPEKMVAYEVDWVVKTILRAKREMGIRCVMLDHGMFMAHLNAQRNPSLAIGDLVSRLKTLAVEEELIIFFLWHFQKAKVESENDLDYGLLRDSGLIACYSDAVFLTYRMVKSDGIIESTTSSIMVSFTRRTGVFRKVIPTEKDGSFLKEVVF